MKLIDNRIKTSIALLAFAPVAGFAGIGFEDLSFTSGDFENGPNLTGTTDPPVNDPYGTGGSLVTKNSTFASSGGGMSATFSNTYNAFYSGANATGGVVFDFWNGWSYSSATDGSMGGSGNQYSSRPASGSRGSANYGVAYQDTNLTFDSAVDFTGLGLDLANTTYAWDSMLNGDAFSDAFTQGDYFRVAIEGFSGGSSTGVVDYYLADFRSLDSEDHYISTEWNFVSLDSLGTVDELQFSFDVTDSGTPTYFAIDNIGVVPEPSSFALLAGAAALVAVARRRKV